jgi:hypothetical protein
LAEPSSRAGHERPGILFSWDAAKSSRSRAKRSWCALKFATHCRISSRSELFRFTGGSRFGSTTVRGMGGFPGFSGHLIVWRQSPKIDPFRTLMLARNRI